MSAYFNPLAFFVFYITSFILIGELFFFENFISEFKFDPLPEINTAVKIFLLPAN